MLDLFTLSWQGYWEGAEDADPVGAIFTKPEVARLILDLAEYVPTRRLGDVRLLEPSCGDGAFLSEIVERLVVSERGTDGVVEWQDSRLDACIRAADISSASVELARALVVTVLLRAGCLLTRANSLAAAWIVHTDYLLESWEGTFDVIVGNPPYVRIENLPRRVLERYRELYETTSDRADIYVAFIERSLQLLSETGVLSFICANRFTKNKYGTALRRLIAARYHVRCFLNLEHTQPFLADVSAYPAILVLDRQRGRPTIAASLHNVAPETLEAVGAEASGLRRPTVYVSRFRTWYPTGEPWTTTDTKEHAMLARLGGSLPSLEESGPGTRVGIGVATGADRVFLLRGEPGAIETSRLLPLAMARDVTTSATRWSGTWLLNPFRDEDDGQLVDLAEYPGFAAHIEAHSELLRSRHVSKARPDIWYRTIDRIWPKLQGAPKLLIPDIQPGRVVGYDSGTLYPHHNLYWITSQSWPLESLRALLRSDLVTLQVRAFSVQMRGGSLRYQAQTLRRVRLPELAALSDPMLERLASLASGDSLTEINDAAEAAFSAKRRQAVVVG